MFRGRSGSPWSANSNLSPPQLAANASTHHIEQIGYTAWLTRRQPTQRLPSLAMSGGNATRWMTRRCVSVAHRASADRPACRPMATRRVLKRALRFSVAPLLCVDPLSLRALRSGG